MTDVEKLISKVRNDAVWAICGGFEYNIELKVDYKGNKEWHIMLRNDTHNKVWHADFWGCGDNSIEEAIQFAIDWRNDILANHPDYYNMSLDRIG